MKHAVLCALPESDLRIGAQPDIRAADGVGQTRFKRCAAFFSHRFRAAEMPRNNDFCRAIRLRLSAANKWPMLQ
ncbi:hypothetical protein ABQJ48_15895 [Paraburkholderia sp. DGU8]